MTYSIVYSSKTGNTKMLADALHQEQILARVRDLLPESVQLVGSYLCPGKMPQSVRDRYVRIAEEEPAKRSHMQKMIFNFDCALSHPDANDLQALIEEVENCQKK